MKSGLFQFDPSPGALPPGSVTNAELADMAARTVKVNATNASAAPQDLQGSTPFDVLRVNAAGDGLEWGEAQSGDYVLKTGDTMTGPLAISYSESAALPQLEVTNSDPGIVGVVFRAIHDSASPTALDTLMAFEVRARNSSAGALNYTNFQSILIDPTAGVETGEFRFRSRVLGVIDTRFL